MTSRDTSPALSVPDEAIDEWRYSTAADHNAEADVVRLWVQAIAAPVVAAELRRLRDAVLAIGGSEHSGSLDVGSALQEAGWLLADRADELETARTGTPT